MKRPDKLKNLTQKKQPQRDQNLSPNLAPIVIKYQSETYVKYLVILTLLFQALLVFVVFYNFTLNQTLSRSSKRMDETTALIQQDAEVFYEVDAISRKIDAYKTAMQGRAENGKHVQAMFSSITNAPILFVEAAVTSDNKGALEVEAERALSAALLIYRLFETEKIDSVAINGADLTKDGTYLIKFEILFK